MMRTYLLAVFVFGLTGLALAQTSGEKDESLTAWYDALAKADGAALDGLIIPNSFAPFSYKITDLGIEQTRQEFVASMEEWGDAINGGTIDYKITEAFEGGFTVLACYRFKSNELLAEEEIAVFDTKIVSVSQTSKGDSCEGF